MKTVTDSYCGLVAIVGRPNVGKSTLLNRMLGQKISITSRKPQTTRYRLLGVSTEGNRQLIFVDTPGWQRAPRSRLNRSMNREMQGALDGVDVVLMLADARGWQEDDDAVLRIAAERDAPLILALNKIDLLTDKAALLPMIQQLQARHDFAEVIPLSARAEKDPETVVATVGRYLPPAPFQFGADDVTDRSERFLAGETVREKLMRLLGDELPYATSVVVDAFEDEPGMTLISVTIWVERPGQKAIVIGKKGEMLKRIGTEARLDLERLLGRKVAIKTWVKVKESWSDDARALRTLGLD